MNERIKELMDQAGKLAYEEHKAKCLKEGLNPSMPYGNSLGKTFEKFAELIVRECASMAESFHHHQYDFTGNLELHEFIKEHFGVEE